jgi:carboxymethylenebutenolidase
MTNTTTLALADGRSLDVYVARPAAPPRGAVVVLQEIFGVNAHIRSVADGFAAEGYVAVAPDMFQSVQPGVELGYGETDMAAGMALKAATEALPTPGVLPDMQAAVDLAARLGGGKVGVVGFCWGSLLTWRAACLLQGVSAAVPYYGGGMTSDAERLRMPRCPVLAHFADEDKYIPVSAVEAFRAEQPGVEVQLYRAHHGFNCDQRGSWNAAAAALARERTRAFLARWLG